MILVFYPFGIFGHVGTLFSILVFLCQEKSGNPELDRNGFLILITNDANFFESVMAVEIFVRYTTISMVLAC
jgi:hypothetical protein